jgi:hypothetical protein
VRRVVRAAAVGRQAKLGLQLPYPHLEHIGQPEQNRDAVHRVLAALDR